MRKTKIIATLGPRWANEETVEKIILEGANVCRLNFSFSTHEEHLERINIIKKISAKLNRPIGILADLQGPKIRIGILKENRVIKEGDIVKLSGYKQVDDDNIIPTTHEYIANDSKKGAMLLIADGTIQLIVEESNPEKKLVTCRTITGGTILSGKGINLPGAHVTTQVLTEKDISDALFAARNGANYLGLSFVRHADDVLRLRKILSDEGLGHVNIISKIENTQALENLEGIIKVSDGVMVARGDLGVEIPFSQVPIQQKKILKLTNELEKISIIATQMLESMTKSPIPSRAEASDVANAVIDGADVVMMSAETASGDYPIESVRAMNAIVRDTEAVIYNHMSSALKKGAFHISGNTEALTESAAYLSYGIDNKLLIALSNSGRTVKLLSKKRPLTPIVYFSDNPIDCAGLTLCHNVYPIIMPEGHNFNKHISNAGEIDMLENTLIEHKLAVSGDKAIVVSGLAWHGRWQENSIRIIKIN